MKNRKNSLIIPTIYLLILFTITSGAYFTKKFYESFSKIDLDNITYVSNSIFERSIPIINIEDQIKAPFFGENITIGRYYYEKDNDIDMKEKSIVYYDGTYMPNTGIDYVSEKEFDVIAIYDGTVIDIEDNELMGKTVKIRHNSELISVYQGINNLEVKKGDMVFTGQKIASSGESRINKDLGNHLHFEIYKNGLTVNPINCIDKKIGDI